MFAPFSQKGTFQEDGFFYPNKWYPIIHSDGSLGYVNLDHGWTNYPNGEYDLLIMLTLIKHFTPDQNS